VLKVDDGFVSDPMTVAAIDLAGLGVVALWLEAMGYSARYLLDGQLTGAQLSGLRCYRADLASALIQSGLWIDRCEGAIEIRHYLRDQWSREKVLKYREDAKKRAAAARAGGRRQAQAPRPAERPAGPSDHVAPGVPCATGWCDGLYHYTRDPSDTSVPRAERASHPCPQTRRRSA